MTKGNSTLKTRLEKSIAAMRLYYDKKRMAIEAFKQVVLVIIDGTNIPAKHQCKELEEKMFRLFHIVSVGNNDRYCQLHPPDSWKIHSVFNSDLLECYIREDPKNQVIEIEADGTDWVMESIMACGPSDHNPKQHVYLVKWTNFTHQEATWETYENMVINNPGLLKNYFEKNSAIEKDGRFKGFFKEKKT
jgi:hypothetical protein